MDFTTEFESGEESNSWHKTIRKLKSEEKGYKVKKRHMPPELIVTPAQITEISESYEKETIRKDSKS